MEWRDEEKIVHVLHGSPTELQAPFLPLDRESLTHVAVYWQNFKNKKQGNAKHDVGLPATPCKSTASCE